MKKAKTPTSLATHFRWVALIALVAVWAVHCGSDAPNLLENGPDGDADSDTDSDSDGDADSDTDSDSDGDGDDTSCGDLNVDFDELIPTVVLLVDRSGSMDNPIGGSGTTRRWDAVDAALFDPTDGVVTALEREVEFGLTLYTGQESGTCPYTIYELDTDSQPKPPALDNRTNMETLFDNNSPPGGWTPTGESLEEVATWLAGITTAGPKAIVLATDGLPNTCWCFLDNPTEPCTAPGGTSMDYDQTMLNDWTVQKAQSVYAATQIPFYVLGISTALASVEAKRHLQEMANVGQGFPMGDTDSDRYILAGDQNTLKEAFDDIIYGVRPCVLELAGEVTSGQEADCNVTIGSQALTYNDPNGNGWTLKDAGTIEFLGSACDTLKTTDETIKVDCPCGAYIVPL